MTKNNKKLLTEEMIPIAPMSGGVYETLSVSVDGYDAEIFIAQRYGSDKIVIMFNELHPKWGEVFTTKYFFFETHGEMGWGHNNEKMEIEII